MQAEWLVHQDSTDPAANTSPSGVSVLTPRRPFDAPDHPKGSLPIFIRIGASRPF